MRARLGKIGRLGIGCRGGYFVPLGQPHSSFFRAHFQQEPTLSQNAQIFHAIYIFQRSLSTTANTDSQCSNDSCYNVYIFFRAHFQQEPTLSHNAQMVYEHIALLERQRPIEVNYFEVFSMLVRLCQF